MESTTVPAEQQKTHIDVYAMVTGKIIAALEKGQVPWRKPWKEGGEPQNLISKRYYRGVNTLLLQNAGYEHNLFLTFKQAKEIGANIKKGEKSHLVVYWNQAEKELEEASNTQEEKKAKLILRYYSVFNISQCENIPERYVAKPVRAVEPIRACEDIVLGMLKPPKIKHTKQKAYYDPVKDYINMPKQASFESDAAYYSTLFHELIHSTGHEGRLNRKTLTETPTVESYSREELVAEIGTCYLQNKAGIIGLFENSTAYIQGWLTKLKNDKRFIFFAAGHAQRATDYILNVKNEEEDKVQAVKIA